MNFKRALNNRLVAVGAGAAVLALLAGGSGYAAGQITSRDVKNESLRGVDIKDGKLGLKELSPGARKQLANLAGQPPALAAQFSATDTVIEKLGGSFKTNTTEIGTFDLEPGTYVVNLYGGFDTAAADSPRTEGTHLMLALRGPTSDSDQFGADLGTCFTGAFPQGDREATCSTTRTITVAEPTKVRVLGFGYNEDQSSTGSGTFTVDADVSAIEVTSAG